MPLNNGRCVRCGYHGCQCQEKIDSNGPPTMGPKYAEPSFAYKCPKCDAMFVTHTQFGINTMENIHTKWHETREREYTRSLMKLPQLSVEDYAFLSDVKVAW